MSEQPFKPEKSKIVPNTFQTPNILADEYMRHLDGDEVKCYVAVTRKTLGWLKRSDHISKTQIIEIAGLSESRVDDCMKALLNFGLVLRTSVQDPTHRLGSEWSLELDDANVNIQALIERSKKRQAINAQRTVKMRARRGDVAQPSCVAQPPRGDVAQPPQKPLSKAINDNNGALEILTTLYLSEIGPVTFLTADLIRNASLTYPAEWFAPAFEIAVKKNARKWAFVEAVLEKWRINGREWTPEKNYANPNGYRSGNTTGKDSQPVGAAPTENDAAIAAEVLAEQCALFSM